MAADRVAQGRGRADQVLALQPAANDQAGEAGPHRQGALGHRARLRGAQTGDRTGPLRGPRLARLPPSFQPLHRSLRLPDRRALPFPPSAPVHPRADQNTCSTPRFPSARGCPSDLSATCSTRSPPSDDASPSPSSRVCPDAPAASPNQPRLAAKTDTVKVGSQKFLTSLIRLPHWLACVNIRSLQCSGFPRPIGAVLSVRYRWPGKRGYIAGSRRCCWSLKDSRSVRRPGAYAPRGSVFAGGPNATWRPMMPPPWRTDRAADDHTRPRSLPLVA